MHGLPNGKDNTDLCKSILFLALGLSSSRKGPASHAYRTSSSTFAHCFVQRNALGSRVFPNTISPPFTINEQILYLCVTDLRKV